MREKDIKRDILAQLELQLCSHFVSVDFQFISNCTDEAYERWVESISDLRDKYLINSEGKPEFLIYHSGCWALFLYYLSNTIYQRGGGTALNRYII